MSQLDKIRNQVKDLYKKNPKIHMDVSLSSPKLILENAEATIKGVYPHIFQIEEMSEGKARRHSLQYSDIHTRHIVIRELTK